MINIPVEELFKDKDYQLELKLISGEGGLREKKISVPRIQKLGLALTGYFNYLHSGRVMVLGSTEMIYLDRLSDSEKRKRIKQICRLDISCLVVTKGLEIPPYLRDAAQRHGIPLFQTTLQSSSFISRITNFLEDRLSPSTSVHGVLVDVLEVGILILGRSGIGKSECALELVQKGYRLVADDVVEIVRRPPATLIGSGPDLIRYHMEIRGLGIINVEDLFGITAVRDKKKIELVVELVSWDPDQEYTQVGFEEDRYPVLGISLPRLYIPVSPGRSMATLIEIAARNYLLKQMGRDSALEFQKRLHQQLLSSSEPLRTLGEEIE